MPPDIKPSNDDTKPSPTNANAMTEPKAPKTCLACGAVGVKNRCGGCRHVYFCDLACQKRIWIAHRPTCQQVANANANTCTDNRTGNANKSATDANTTPAAPVSAMRTSAHASPRKKSVVLITPTVDGLELPAPANTNSSTTNTMPPTPTVSTSKKHKKKKKKPRSNSLHAPASAAMAAAPSKNRSHSLSVKKHIMWGAVHAREFTRFPGGGGAVPYDGSWALGLGSPVADVQLGSVLEVEELRLQELEARAKELTKSKRHHVREGETRQFDYKHGVRNPLFGRLSERERKKLFSEAEVQHMLEQEAAHVHSVHKSQRRRSASSDETPTPPVGDADPLTDLDADFACVASEQLNEFAVIRDSRDDSCGCSCGDLVKKVAKMNLKKLQQFLSARGVRLPPTTAKPEVLARAKAIAMQEKNCSNAVECECAKHGVPCHSNVCVGCAGDCANPHKQYSYQKHQVEEYRREQLDKWKASNATPASITVA